MKIAIGCDEAGCGLKHIIIDLLQKEGIEVTDEGCRDDEVVLYPNIAERVANIVADGEADRGILICGTGIGMAMAANKVKGIRAAVCHDYVHGRQSHWPGAGENAGEAMADL